MFLKVFLLLFVLVRLAFIRSEDGIDDSALLESIQSDLFEKLNLYTQGSWNYTAPGRQNIHLFPVLIKIRHNLILMKLFHETNLDFYYSQEKFLETPYALARTLDQMQNSTNVELKFRNAIFYDRRYISQQYLNDVKTYYHSEPFEISFAPENEREVSTLINSWTLVNTKGKQLRTENLRTKGLDSFHSTVFSFSGCWNVPKTIISIETRLRRRRFVPVPQFVRLNFDLFYEGIDVPAFSAREKIGYYDDAERKYEAIRVPLKNDELAMALVLPYYNNSLELFRTFTVADYRLLLQRLNKNTENIHYTIPVINTTNVLINEQGISINGDVDELCDSNSISDTYDTSEMYFKPFLVNRPFGILLYHEKTAFVLFYALVRNPTLSLGPRPKFRIQVNMLGEVGDSQHISPL